MHILIAPNAFKHSLTAHDAARAIAEGLQESGLQFSATLFPIGDGGDGTGKLIVDHFNGLNKCREVRDPLGRKINASFGLIEHGKTAVIEMADSSGLRLLERHELNPLIASSYGTGELIVEALNKGVTRIIIAMGGSATVDGGAGILTALGARFLSAEGLILSSVEKFMELDRVEVSGIDKRIFDCEVIVLCDVDNPLLGNHGAAKVFGPQKGASGAGVEQLEKALINFAEVVYKETGKRLDVLPYGGTAGGAAAGLYAFINAKLEHGIEYFLGMTDFEEALKGSDLVITGEGSIDEQTLQGKGPFGVAKCAKKRGIKMIGFAGRVTDVNDKRLRAYFELLIPINKYGEDLEKDLKHAYQHLKEAAREFGVSLKTQNGGEFKNIR